MTPLNSNRYTKYRDGLITALPVQEGAHIFKGSLVCVDAEGCAVPGGDSAVHTFMGVALEEVDNSEGKRAAFSVRVQTSGVFSFAKASALPQSCVGEEVYIVDDQTVGLDADVSCHIPCGRLEALDGGDVWVRIKLA